jgi:hypothetical protein
MSCSEYLTRQQLRTPKYIDTRPKMTCGQMIEIQRQQASAVYEQFSASTSCVSTLNAPSTVPGNIATVARGHRVKDASAYVSHASANATASMLKPINVKDAQIQATCYGPIANFKGSGQSMEQIREVNDTIKMSTLLPTTDPDYRKEDRIAAARQAINNCCQKCGKVNFASGCACAPAALKNTYAYPRTVT